MVQTGAESKWLKGTAGRGSLNSHVGNRISRAGTAEVRQKETSRRREALSRVIERVTPLAGREHSKSRFQEGRERQKAWFC